MRKSLNSASSLSKKSAGVFGDLGAIDRLDKDLKSSVKVLSRDEVRTLVDYYYIIQDNRKASNNQIKQLEKSGEPHALLRYVHDQTDVLESQIKKAMELWTEEHIVAKIIKEEVMGIGPVISAGLIAYFDINRAKTAGSFWRYAGLDPSSKWLSRDKVSEWVKDHSRVLEVDEEGREVLVTVPVDDLIFRAAAFFGRNADTLRKFATTDRKGNSIKLTYDTLVKALCVRPYNASLKVLCWKIGDCFMKFSNFAKKECPNCGHVHKCNLNSPHVDDNESEEGGSLEQVEDNKKNLCKNCDHDISSVPAIPACFYGQLYRKQKQHLLGLNASGGLARTSADTLSKKNIKDPKTLATYKSGMLSDGHIDGMAKRYAVKLFLSNLHELWCAIEKIPCPDPFAMSILRHTHYVCQPELLDYINKAKSLAKMNGNTP